MIGQVQRVTGGGGESPGCLATGKTVNPCMTTPSSISPWKMMSRLQLCFSSRPIEAAKSDGSDAMANIKTNQWRQ